MSIGMLKRKCGDKAKLCYTDTDSFIVHVKSEEICADLAGDVEERFDRSKYEFERPLPMGKNTKVIGLAKDETGGKIMKDIVALKPKMYSYLTVKGHEEMCNQMGNKIRGLQNMSGKS